MIGSIRTAHLTFYNTLLVALLPSMLSIQKDAQDVRHEHACSEWLCGSGSHSNACDYVQRKVLLQLFTAALDSSCGFSDSEKPSKKKVVLVKTPKAASGTLHHIIGRFALTNKLRCVCSVYNAYAGNPLFKFPENVLAEHERCFDFDIRHWDLQLGSGWNAGKGLQDHRRRFSDYIDQFRFIIGAEVAFVIPIRNPLKLLVSHLLWNRVPVTRLASDTDEAVARYGLAGQFGVFTSADLQEFQSLRADSFHVTVVEEFDTSLALLRREVRWSLWDMLFTKETHGIPAERTETALKQLNTTNLPLQLDREVHNTLFQVYRKKLQGLNRSVLQIEANAIRRLSKTAGELCLMPEAYLHVRFQKFCWHSRFDELVHDALAFEQRGSCS